MPLLQNIVVAKHAQSLYRLRVELEWKLFKTYFNNPEVQNKVRNSKEGQFQEVLLRGWFFKILGS